MRNAKTKTKNQFQKECYGMMAVTLSNLLPVVERALKDDPENIKLVDLECTVRIVLEWQERWAPAEALAIEKVLREKYAGYRSDFAS